MSDVLGRFLRPMLRHFSMPKGANESPEAWENDYVEALSFYSDAVLDFASKKLIFADRKSNIFPLPAECLRACKEVHNEFSQPVKAEKNARHDEWSLEAMKEADRLLCSNIGRKASDEGWAWQLWDFMRREQRWPNSNEADDLRAKSRSLSAETSEFIDNAKNTVGIASSTKKLLAKMSSRRKNLREIAYGESCD